MKYLPAFVFFYRLSLCATAQYYLHPTTLGLHFQLNDFKDSKSFRLPDLNTGGISIEFKKGINKYFDLDLSTTGSFPALQDHSADSLLKKRFLLQNSHMVMLHAFSQHIIQPFLSMGIQWFAYDKHLSLNGKAGPGIEIHLKDVFFTLSSFFSPSFYGRIPSNFGFNIGIEGLVFNYKKKSKNSAYLSNTGDQSFSVQKNDIDHLQLQLKQMDADGDGIPDLYDLCPSQPGISDNNGCPLIESSDSKTNSTDSCKQNKKIKENIGAIDKINIDKVKKVLALASNIIYFNSGSYIILHRSFKALDEVVLMLNNFPFLHLMIEGYTDNKGTRRNNEQLSRLRSKAIYRYLVMKHIDKSRLSFKGFGESKPMAPNSTPEGRTMNRRVTFAIKSFK